MNRHGRRSGGLAAVGVLAVLVWAPTPAAADPVLAANCPGPREGTNTAPGMARYAQSFTSQVTGTPTSASVDINKSPSSAGDYGFTINETDATGVPTDSVLASAIVPNASVPDNASIVSFGFTNAAALAAGQQYALVVTRPAGGLFTVGVRTTDACAGALFQSDSPSGAFTPGGAGRDMVFEVLVEPTAEPIDSAAPTTTITKGPKDKTKKKSATFEFTGTDTRAIASFQCSLDGGAFTACASPHTVKVKKGKHTFQVRAVDQAGNVGTPASDDWKVKKKKK